MASVDELNPEKIRYIPQLAPLVKEHHVTRLLDSWKVCE
jgi:hypothetical protein